MPEPKISVRDVLKHFGEHAEVLALDHVDLTIATGEFVTIVGPSGCGKSTLLYMLAGFIAQDAGTLAIDGMPIAGPGNDRGVVFQEYALFPWLSVYDNIAFGLARKGLSRAECRPIVERYIETIGLAGFEQRYPRELSGGMKQRVALARTFAYDPDVLLLDEPFGALDSQTREIMQDELRRLCGKSRKTVFMVTHDVDEAVYLSDRVCVMCRRPGKIVSEFAVDIDRTGSRERVVLSEPYAALRNKVWLAVREQVAAARSPSPGETTSAS